MMNTRFGEPFGESFDGTSQKVLVINIVPGVQVRWVSLSSDEAAVRMFGRYSLGGEETASLTPDWTMTYVHENIAP